jgi:hypothetical protein
MTEVPEKGDEAAERRPYQKPSIAWEESVEEQERLMSACGKTQGDGACSGAEEFS